ncbi:hypothetical protein DWZ40_07550 [Clostridium sp. AF32-12BH]|nr:hypothetical protein DWZ40_07550 [Clostridium sp. AF32-12BH]
MDYILIKYFGEEKYRKAFLDGNLYMNSLYYFRNQFALDQAAEKRRKDLEKILNWIRIPIWFLFLVDRDQDRLIYSKVQLGQKKFAEHLFLMIIKSMRLRMLFIDLLVWDIVMYFAFIK